MTAPPAEDRKHAAKDHFAAATPGRGLLAVTAVSRRRFARHTHAHFGIGVILEGAQRSASGRGPVEARAGQIITVNPNEVHDGLPIDDQPRAWSMVYVDPDHLERFGLGNLRDRELHRPVFEDRDAARTILALHRAIMAGDCAEETAENLLPLTLGPLMAAPAPGATHSAGIRRAMARIDEAPECPHPIAEQAHDAALSRWHFIRAFAGATGLTPQAYRRQRQLQRARVAIETGLPLSKAAVLAGFADQSHMTRLFSGAYGYTPGQLASAGRRRR